MINEIINRIKGVSTKNTEHETEIEDTVQDESYRDTLPKTRFVCTFHRLEKDGGSPVTIPVNRIAEIDVSQFDGTTLVKLDARRDMNSTREMVMQDGKRKRRGGIIAVSETFEEASEIFNSALEHRKDVHKCIEWSIVQLKKIIPTTRFAEDHLAMAINRLHDAEKLNGYSTLR